MLSLRSLASLAQLLELFEAQFVIVLFAKHGLRLTIELGAVLLAAHNALRDQAESPSSIALLDEVV